MSEQTQIPLYSGADSAHVAADIAPLVDFQDDGVGLDQLRLMISQHLESHLMRYDQTSFQSMFNAFPAPEAKLGAQIALDYNQGVTNWQVSPGGAVLEKQCCKSLCKLFELDPKSDATFMYSGTYANQQALYMALHRHAERQGFDLAQKGIAGFDDPKRLAILVSSDAHFSLKHAVRILGLGEECLIHLPVDASRRIDINILKSKILNLKSSHDIVCMVATAGTTSTGAIDPISEMADLCDEIGSWLHVDGAYGYAYKLVPQWAEKFKGDARADSIVWDPHKQLGAPIPNSVLFVKHGGEFARMALHSSYFNRAEDAEPNPGVKSPPSTRPMSALPLVTILRGKGLNQVIEELRAPLLAIRSLAEYIHSQPDVELLHQPDTGVLCFRMTPENMPPQDLDSLQQEIFHQIMLSGKRSVSITNIAGQKALRLVIVSPRTSYDDLLETISELRMQDPRLLGERN